MATNQESLAPDGGSDSVSWYSLTKYYLSTYQYDCARFYAERLYYDNPTARNLHMLAKSYFSVGKFKQTYLLLQDVRFCKIKLPPTSTTASSSSSVPRTGYLGTTPTVKFMADKKTPIHYEEAEEIKANQYLLALCCVQLGKFDEAEAILQPDNRLEPLSKITAESLRDTIPGGANGVYLMGKICRRQHRKDFAKHYYHITLQVSYSRVSLHYTY